MKKDTTDGRCGCSMEPFRKDLLAILACPLCNSQLHLEFFSATRKDGIFRCDNNHCYPLISGLPKILVGELSGDYSQFLKLYGDELASRGLSLQVGVRERCESKQVQEAFRDKWASKDTMGIADSSPYKGFMRSWMLAKYGWRDEAGFSKALSDKALILDAGAGLGRETINLARAARNSVVVGIEFSDCAESALRNVSSVQNAWIIQGDIMRMPFKEASFDFILSEGVLHHTPNTREAFAKCCGVLKPDGEIAFYVYRKKGPAREFTDDYVRQIMQNASHEQKWRISERITRLGKALSDLKTKVTISEPFPELGIRAGEQDIHRFVYWNFLKCFWNDELPFQENVIINFDWFAPEHAHRHTEAEIRSWCHENNIQVVWFHEEESGYSVRGVKKAQTALK